MLENVFGANTKNTILNAHKYDEDRIESIKIKVQSNLHINKQQINIYSYYFTTKGGITAWVETDEYMVKEVLKRAQTAQMQDFKTAIFVPKLARDRKTSIDKLLLAYKKNHNDFKYLIRNGDRDLKVLVKRISEQHRVPYREINLEALGNISPLKPNLPLEKDGEIAPEINTDEDGYSPTKLSRRTLWKNRVSERNIIFSNITSFLDGFY